jgi:hypothetical protein
MHRTGISFVVVALVAGVVSVGRGTPVSAAPLARQADPVVLTGADLPTMVNGSRSAIVGFRWTGTVWQQLPIQIDERAVVNFGKVYNNPSAVFYGSQPGLVNQLVYTSSATWTGNDPNPKFDSNDELAFMARDAGLQAAGGSTPAGVVPTSGVEVHVTDPLAPGSEGFVYLFDKASHSGLAQGAHVKYVKYSFKLLSGKYKTTYSSTAGPNPENSVVTGATYAQHFADRWLSDSLKITAPGATGVDILDRNKTLFAPTVCSRSEDTFDATGPYGSAEGAFVTNKVGPVRAIRSYVGANSGPNTQRTQIFYDRREDVVTNLRVHAIPSVMDFFDYSPAASGMTYRNSVNPAGVTIDGNPDSPTAGQPTWEQITGPQGTVTHVHSLVASTPPASITSYYLDDTTPTDPQCTGDAFAYGSSGVYINSAIPCTDPALGCGDTLVSTRTMFFDPPGGTAATAAAHADEVANPLQFTTAAWLP